MSRASQAIRRELLPMCYLADVAGAQAFNMIDAIVSGRYFGREVPVFPVCGSEWD
jgi:hypothetical protein